MNIKSDQLISYEIPPFSVHLTAPPSGTFASKIILKDILRIHVCYRMNHCTGMTFTFVDGKVETLGQWFECTGQHDLLFDMTINKKFTGLQFELHGESHCAVVRRVTLLGAKIGTMSSADTVLYAKSFVSIVPLRCYS
jgi:hypothetical protein